MKIKILRNIVGSANAQGSTTRVYAQDEIVEANEEWQKKLAHQFMEAQAAEEVKVTEPSETKKVRARTKSGHYVADDPSTPDVNEVWEVKTDKK